MQWIICWNIYLFIISFLISLSSAWIVKPLAEAKVEDVPQPETKVMICDITVVKKQKEEDISDRKRGLF